MDIVRETEILLLLAGTSASADSAFAERAPELLEELRDELTSARERLEELEKRNDELEGVEEEKSAFEEENRRLEERLAKLDEALADLRVEHAELRARAEKAEYEAQRLRFALQGQKDKTPSAKQLEALKALETAPKSSWDFGSSTVNTLRKCGWIEDVWTEDGGDGSMRVRGRIRITDKGRAALESARVAEAFAIERKDDKP